MLLLIFCAGLLLIGAQAQSDAPDFLEAEIDNLTPYLGEPIIYTWRLLSRDMQRSRRFMQPDFSGFGVVNDRYLDPTSEIRNNRFYTVLSQRLVLLPARPGLQRIPPMRITAPATPFDDAVTLESAAFDVDVRPLPPGAPPSFVNAVGQYSISATLSDNTLAVGDATELRLVVQGSGNLSQAVAPPLRVSEAWRAYRQNTQFTQETPLLGTKTFRWTLIAAATGTHTLDTIAFSYFDPQSEQYITRTSDPITVSVSPGDDPFQGFSRNENDVANTTATTQALKPLRANLSTHNTLPTPTDGLLWLLPPLLIVLAWATNSRRKATTPQQKQPSGKRSQALNAALAQLQSAQGLGPKAAYDQAGKAILGYLGQKTKTTINRSTLTDVLDTMPDEPQQALRKLLAQINAGRYAPVTAEDAQAILKATHAALTKVDQQWRI